MIDAALKVQEDLDKLKVDAVLFNHSEIIPSANLRYLSGFTGSDASIVISPKERRLFTDGRYKTQAANEALGYEIHVVRRKVEALARLIKRLGVRRLGVEASRVSFDFMTLLGKKAPGVELVPLRRDFLEKLRTRKRVDEKAIIAGAAAIASQACRETLDKGLEGRAESEIAAELELGFRRLGAQGIAFETIVASGERSALPHGAATEKVIRKGELVTLDFGCKVDGYHSDETVACVVGPPTDEQAKIHRVVRLAHDAAIDALKIGVKAKDVDKVAREIIRKEGFGQYFLHGLGHGVGLEIHEPPSLSPLGKGVIEEGSVFTIEPGIYVEGLGGVRLESLLYMGKGGPEILSRMPKDLLVVD